MKILKGIVLFIVGFIASLLIVALFIDKDYAVQREITINKPKTVVFEYLKLLKNQENFSVWATRDPNMKKEFRGTDGTVGFVAAWDSDMKDVGKGEQEIKKINEGERIDYELRFIKPFEATDNAYISTEAISDSLTKVTWAFNGSMDYPMNLMLLTMNMDEMLGKDLQAGLTNLKIHLEK
jgi:hypothetical protein